MTNVEKEKNEAVARKLGWKLFDQHYQYWIPPTIEATHKYGDRPSHLPLYTKSIDAAWEIVLSIKPEWTMWRDRKGIHFWIWEDFRNGTPLSAEVADTAPMAIVEAFLKLP